MEKEVRYVQFHGRGLRAITRKDPVVVDFQGKVPDCERPHAEPLSMADVLGCTVGGQLRSADGSMTVDFSTGTVIVRGTYHSLNDGLRDTFWRRADRAVKRWFRGSARYLKGCFYCGIDEVGHFVLKVIGAGLTLYAVACVAVHFYG